MQEIHYSISLQLLNIGRTKYIKTIIFKIQNFTNWPSKPKHIKMTNNKLKAPIITVQNPSDAETSEQRLTNNNKSRYSFMKKFLHINNHKYHVRPFLNQKSTWAIEVKHSSNGKRSLSEFGSCCHFPINGGIKISRYLGCNEQQKN